MIDDCALAAFKELYHKRFGVRLSERDAFRKASNLVNLYRAVYGVTEPGEKEVDRASGEQLKDDVMSASDKQT